MYSKFNKEDLKLRSFAIVAKQMEANFFEINAFKVAHA